MDGVVFQISLDGDLLQRRLDPTNTVLALSVAGGSDLQFGSAGAATDRVVPHAKSALVHDHRAVEMGRQLVDRSGVVATGDQHRLLSDPRPGQVVAEVPPEGEQVVVDGEQNDVPIPLGRRFDATGESKGHCAAEKTRGESENHRHKFPHFEWRWQSRQMLHPERSHLERSRGSPCGCPFPIELCDAATTASTGSQGGSKAATTLASDCLPVSG